MFSPLYQQSPYYSNDQLDYLAFSGLRNTLVPNSSNAAASTSATPNSTMLRNQLNNMMAPVFSGNPWTYPASPSTSTSGNATNGAATFKHRRTNNAKKQMQMSAANLQNLANLQQRLHPPPRPNPSDDIGMGRNSSASVAILPDRDVPVIRNPSPSNRTASRDNSVASERSKSSNGQTSYQLGPVRNAQKDPIQNVIVSRNLTSAAKQSSAVVSPSILRKVPPAVSSQDYFKTAFNPKPSSSLNNPAFTTVPKTTTISPVLKKFGTSNVQASQSSTSSSAQSRPQVPMRNVNPINISKKIQQSVDPFVAMTSNVKPVQLQRSMNTIPQAPPKLQAKPIFVPQNRSSGVLQVQPRQPLPKASQNVIPQKDASSRTIAQPMMKKILPSPARVQQPSAAPAASTSNLVFKDNKLSVTPQKNNQMSITRLTPGTSREEPRLSQPSPAKQPYTIKKLPPTRPAATASGMSQGVRIGPALKRPVEVKRAVK